MLSTAYAGSPKAVADAAGRIGQAKGIFAGSRSYALCAIALAVALSMAAVVPLPDTTQPASSWHGDAALLPLAAAHVAGGPHVEESGIAGEDHAMRHALHRPAEVHLHPSTLALSEYPAVGGGTAELVFAVTYAGDMRQGGVGGSQRQAEPPFVHLDVTGSEYTDLYRVTNIESNIGTAAPDIFEPYDFETETARAEQGAAYTVRATIEFVAEGFIPVYAIGFDGDIVTVNVAASELETMSYDEYVSTGQNYLDSGTEAPATDPAAQADALAPEKRHASDLLDLYPSLSSLPPATAPPSESAMLQTFDATGTVMTENAAGNLVPVHGISVCLFDTSPLPYPLTRLNTTVGESACGYTDASGTYEILNVSGVDLYDMSTPADVFASVASIGYDGAVVLQQYNQLNGRYYLYFGVSGVEPDYGGTMLVNNFSLRDGYPNDGGMAGAARIISAISDGMAFFEGHGQTPANLTVRWNHIGGTSVFPGTNVNGAFYVPSAATIYLDGMTAFRTGGDTVIRHGDSYDRHTILHELAHHVHLVHDPEFEQDCSTHYIHKKYDEACAWGEGWAQLVPHLVDDSVDVPRGTTGIRYNIETGQTIRGSANTTFDRFEASGRPVGEKVEGTVAAAMWDMIDDAVHPTRDVSPGSPEGGDRSSAGVDALLGVFFGGTYDTFADFYDRWEIDMRRDSAEGIAILHGMSFAIPSNTSYYGFAGELDGVFKRGVSNLVFRPNYVDVSGDGSTVAITSLLGQGLQMVDVRDGEHRGLHSTHGHNHACTLEEYPFTCIGNSTARAMADTGSEGFSSMDGIAYGLDSSVLLVSDGSQDRVQVIGSDGGYLGSFGAPGNSSGEFDTPDGIAFLPGEPTAAVADALNRRVQTFTIDGDGGARYDGQFTSYDVTEELPSFTTQQLAADTDGTLYAAGYASARSSIWVYPQPHASSNAMRIDDPSLCSLGGIGVDQDGLVYVSDRGQGRIRVYDLDNLRGDVSESTAQPGGRQLTVRQVQSDTSACGVLSDAEAFIDEFGSLGRYTWQLGAPLGVALGPPDAGTGDVRVYVADLNGVKMYEKDRERPRVVSVWAHTADGTVVSGDTVEIAVNFTERVTVTGTPVLALETGAAGSNATYVSGSGSRTLTFNYTVGAGTNQSYIDYDGTDSLMLPPGNNGSSSAAIIDGSGNAANLTLPERGTAASLAANAALWIGANRTDMAPFGLAAIPTVEAVEHQRIEFAISAANGSNPAADNSYNMTGGPPNATISANGTFTWLPGEADSGMHAFAVRASQQGDANTTHARTFRILVAENNTAPVVEPVNNMTVVELSEVRFDIRATDVDLPEQDLWYRLSSDWLTFATVLPNGTFVWTPSVYDLGTTEFNVTVGDGFDSGTADDGQDSTTSVVFSVTVDPIRPSPLSVYALAPDGLKAEQELLYGVGQTVRIAVDFSEPVTVAAGPGGATPYMELLAGDNSTYRALYDSGSGSRTLVFGYTTSEGGATDLLSYAGTGALVLNGGTIASVESGEEALTTLPRPGSPNSLSGSSIVRVDVIRPAVESVYAPAGNMPYAAGGQVDIAVKFSENVTVMGSPAIELETGAADRDAVYGSGNSTDTLVFRYTVQAGDSSPLLDYTGTDALRAGAGSSIRDAAGNDADLTLPAPGGNGSIAASAHISIGGGGQEWTGERNVTLNIMPGGIPGTGNVTRGGNETHVMLNVTQIAAGNDTDTGAGNDTRTDEVTATFPSGGTTINATFATVTFPPDATATSVPAHGVLVMRVVNNASGLDVQSALAYDGSNRVVVQRVVEIGEADGRVDFDMPVRISLDGLAGGRAFYVEANNTPIIPIDLACAADDLQRVHLQMDGEGECQMDSEDGSDKIIYTYHLTWFGTVLSESGAPAAPDHTCSVRIASQSLGVEARPGAYSPADSQTVINLGSLPFSSVGLHATPWYANMSGPQPGPDTPRLPSNISEVSEDGGAYRTVENGTAVAVGLGGGLERPLQFKVNLAALGSAVQGGDLTQYITYVAECGRPAGQQ